MNEPEQCRAFDELLAIVGTSREGDRLPAERRLAEQLGISRSAVRRALRELCHRDLIATRRQSGSFVTAPDHTDTMQQRAEPIRIRLIGPSRRTEEERLPSRVEPTSAPAGASSG